MNTSLPKKYQKWEKTRQKGVVKFVLLYWTLGWGIFMCIGMSLFDYFDGESITPDDIATSLFIYCLMGTLCGVFVWSTSENRYQKYIAKEN